MCTHHTYVIFLEGAIQAGIFYNSQHDAVHQVDAIIISKSNHFLNNRALRGFYLNQGAMLLVCYTIIIPPGRSIY
jgi:hypothetical protein